MNKKGFQCRFHEDSLYSMLLWKTNQNLLHCLNKIHQEGRLNISTKANCALYHHIDIALKSHASGSEPNSTCSDISTLHRPDSFFLRNLHYFLKKFTNMLKNFQISNSKERGRGGGNPESASFIKSANLFLAPPTPCFKEIELSSFCIILLKDTQGSHENKMSLAEVKNNFT